MNALTAGRAKRDWDAHTDDEQDERMPRRARRRFLTRTSATLVALVTCAIGFYAGVRVEKGRVSSSTSSLTLPTSGGATSSRAAGFAALFGRSRSGATGATGATGAAGATGGTGAAGAAGGFGGGLAAAFGGGDTTAGSVASVSGRTIDVTETASGNTVKVKLTPVTKVSKTMPVSHSAIRPGDTVVVTGVTGSKGTVTAASVTDSGAGRSVGSSSTSSSGSSSSSSAVGSLFSSSG
jgi:hypothetical protein